MLTPSCAYEPSCPRPLPSRPSARDQAKRKANRTMAENCARDGVRNARAPRGGIAHDEVPVAQREAILAAMRDRLIPHYSAEPADLAGIYQRGIDSAWKEFRRLGKTQDGYGLPSMLS